MLPRYCFIAGLLAFTPAILRAQTAPSPVPVVVQPGAPGQPTKVLPPDTTGTAPALSQADVKFMQDMIMHHGQAVEMTALIDARTDNREVRAIGAKIKLSQTDEMNFMKHWLTERGQSTAMPMNSMGGMCGMKGMDMKDMPGMNMGNMDTAPMPGMLTPRQMEALRKAHGPEFDYLFLTGMIQHHTGALSMVKALFDSPGAGQDADIFNFATDVDNTQRAEIRIMQDMLQHTPKGKQ